MTPDLVMVCRCGLEYLCDDIDEADAWLRTHEHKPQGGQMLMDLQDGQLKLPKLLDSE